MTQAQQTMSLRRFTTENGIPYGTCRNWLLENQYDTSSGLSPQAQSAAIAHFKPAAAALPPSTPASAAMVVIDSGSYSLAMPGQTTRRNTEELLDEVLGLTQQPTRLLAEELTFDGLDQIEASLQERLQAAGAKRQQLNDVIVLINQRAAEVQRLRSLQQAAGAIDADNQQVEADIQGAAKKLKEAEAELQQLQLR